MCGEHRHDAVKHVIGRGSSPHVRGARTGNPSAISMSGIIPACAGSTHRSREYYSAPRDHPRMCGEHSSGRHELCHGSGSSPHVRGAPVGRVHRLCPPGIIPACAGSTHWQYRGRASAGDHPRMCGEHAGGRPPQHEIAGSSPHVRGAHFENSIIPRKRKDNWLFFIQFRFENFLAFRYLLALLHPFLGVPTKDPSFASLGRLINCNPSQSTGDQSAPYTLKAICCSFLAE